MISEHMYPSSDWSGLKIQTALSRVDKIPGINTFLFGQQFVDNCMMGLDTLHVYHVTPRMGVWSVKRHRNTHTLYRYLITAVCHMGTRLHIDNLTKDKESGYLFCGCLLVQRQITQQGQGLWLLKITTTVCCCGFQSMVGRGDVCSRMVVATQLSINNPPLLPAGRTSIRESVCTQPSIMSLRAAHRHKIQSNTPNARLRRVLWALSHTSMYEYASRLSLVR